MKTCVKCDRPEGEVSFAVEKTRNGEYRARRDCKECRKGYLRRHYANNPEYFAAYRSANRSTCNQRSINSTRRARHERYDAIARIKSKPCQDCGKAYPPCVMDFDHRDPALKSAGVSDLVKSSVSWATVVSEIDKCDLVCRNCHALRTYKGDKGYRSRTWKANRARLDGLKSTTPCLDCVNIYAPCQMEFDHVRGVKSRNVSQMVEGPWADIELEMAKCELVCANCHRVRTKERSPGWAADAGPRVRTTTSSQEIRSV